MQTWVWNCILFHVSTFWLGSDTSGTFSLLFTQPWETSLEDWKILIFWCRADIYSCKLSAKVSLMLDNLFPVLSLCKLNHISVCFIQISMKLTCKQFISFRESNVFLADIYPISAVTKFDLKSTFPYSERGSLIIHISWKWTERNKTESF